MAAQWYRACMYQFNASRAARQRAANDAAKGRRNNLRWLPWGNWVLLSIVFHVPCLISTALVFLILVRSPVPPHIGSSYFERISDRVTKRNRGCSRVTW